MHIKLIATIFLFSCLCVLFVNSADAQTWQSLNGPSATSSSLPNQTIIQGDTLFAVPGAGTIFKKSIHNTQWIPVSSGISETIKSFALDDQGNYYAVDFEVVFPTEPPFSIQNFSFSENYGQSWKFVENLFDLVINEIFIVESDEVLLGGGGIHLLSEDKESFNTVDSTFSVNTFYQHYDTLIAGGFNGIGISENEGMTWENIGPDTLQVQSVTSFGEILLIASNNNIILKENLFDDGELISNLPETTINVLHTAGNQIYAGTESGILSIDTESLTANPVFPGLTDKNIFSIDTNSDIFYTGTDASFYRCMIATNSCEPDSSPNSLVRSLSISNPDTLFVGTNRSIYRYFISSERWDSLSIPIGRARNFIPTTEDSFYTINDTHFFACSFQGAGCDSTRIEEPGTALFDLKQNTAGDLFLASRERVFKSTDKGENWETIYTNPDNINFSLFTFSDSLLFINGGRLIKYSLNNEAFDELNNSIDVITTDGTIYSSVNGIQKSTDFGETWTTILQSSDITNSGLGGLKSLLYDEEEEKLYAITTMGGVFVSENEGEQWGVSEEFSPAPVENAAISPNGTIYLGTRGAGVFTNTQPLNPPITISNENEPEVTVPDEFALHQNYPNPFNPSTTITYSLPEPAEVRLTVYNVVGQEVAVLLNRMQNQGVQTVQFDAGHLASGLYLYKLETEKYSEIRKMMLVK